MMATLFRASWAGWIGTLLIHGVIVGLLLWGGVLFPSTPPVEHDTTMDLADVTPAPPEPPPQAPPPPPPPSEDAAPSNEPAPPVAEKPQAAPAVSEPDYLPQFKIEQAPVFPDQQVLSQMVYPPLAAKQGVEGTVILELSIDAQGVIRHIAVLKDPGFGFAEAAVKALAGIRVKPAQAGGQSVAVRYRYPIRFTLK
jgi:protein TonB